MSTASKLARSIEIVRKAKAESSDEKYLAHAAQQLKAAREELEEANRLADEREQCRQISAWQPMGNDLRTLKALQEWLNDAVSDELGWKE